MTKKLSLGIDVSKDSLDCSLYDGKCHKKLTLKENKSSSVNKIIKYYKLNTDNCTITMEATGIYHTAIYKGFYEAGFKVSVDNPLKIKAFATAALYRVKTDAVDARIIAEFGCRMEFSESIPKASHQEELIVYLKLIEDLKSDIVRSKNRIEALSSAYLDTKEAIKSLKKLIKSTEVQISKSWEKIHELINNNCRELYELYLSVPGVGNATAAAIVGYFGDFSEFSNTKKPVAYVGLSPSPKVSGTSVNMGGGISKKGNSYLRKMLYMCSLTAKRYNKPCKSLFDRIVARGKRKKVALIAVACKILRQLFAIGKSRNKYDPDYLQKAC
jgi:transposase